MIDIFGNKISGAWRGTACKLLHDPKDQENRELKEEFKRYRMSCPLDFKAREHYYTKSYIIPKILKDSNISTVFHVGFGREDRYPWSYESFFQIKFSGCELDLNQGSWMKNGKNLPLVIRKDFMSFSLSDLEKLFNDNKIDLKSACVVSESTFYYGLRSEINSWSDRHTLKNSIECDDKYKSFEEDLKKSIEVFYNFGFRNFMFIEPDTDIFENLNLKNCCYTKILLGENFKYDFLTSYHDYQEIDIFSRCHLITNSKDLISNARILER